MKIIKSKFLSSGKSTPSLVSSVAVAITVSVPLVLASPAAAETEVAQNRIAFLRGIVGSNVEISGQHPILRDVVIAAQNEVQGKSQDLVVGHTNGHTNGHANSHTDGVT